MALRQCVKSVTPNPHWSLQIPQDIVEPLEGERASQFLLVFSLIFLVYKGYGGQVECCRNDSVSELCFVYEMGSEVGVPQKVGFIAETLAQQWRW